MNRRTRRALAAFGFAILLAAGVHVAAVRDMNAERRARRYLGGRLYAEVRGGGDPIVFLAGLQGSTRYWGSAFDPLTASHRLIFVDALGFGRSPWPAESHYTLDDQLDALRRTLVALGATRNVTFVAHSFGTVLAAYYAARYPTDIRGVVLLGAPVWDSAAEGRARIRQLSSLGATFTFNRPLALAVCEVMCAFRPLLRRVLPLLDRSRPPEVVSDSVLHDITSFDGAVDILLHKPIAVPIRELGPRVTLIHGRNDLVTPLAEVEALARASGARLIAVDSDHQQYLTRALDVITAAILAADGAEAS